MQFTAREMKLLERLRKQERRWPRDRWIVLLAGIAALCCYGSVMALLLHKLQFEELQSLEYLIFVLVFAMVWPKCLLMFALAGWLIVWAIQDWQGNATRTL